MLMPLVVGGVLDRLNVYAPMFIWAGLMSPARVGALPGLRRLEDGEGRFHRRHQRQSEYPPLLAGSALTSLLGEVGITIVLYFWEFLHNPKTHSTTHPAAGLVASTGIVLIGIALIYAGLPKGKKAAA